MAWMAAKTMRRAPVTGAEGLVGEIALAKTDVAPRGQVFLHGELWEAISEAPIRQGEEAEVKSVKGLTLTVAPRHK
jgi:membrane-bound serine protease (ClpP class)